MKRFNTLNGLQNYIRKNGTPDVFKLKGMTFTMDMYDMEGREIYYGNKKYSKSVSVTTSDRYGETKFKDATVELYDAVAFSNGIHYVE